MPVCSLSARHRAVGRPVTALSDLADCATGTLAVVGRRSGVVIAASGLIMSVVVAPASAAPSTMAPAAASAVDTSTLTAAARAALDTSPVVSVPTNATWVLDDPVVKIVADPASKAAPKPAPKAAAAASPSTTAAATGAVPASANGSAVIEIASRYVGVPYVWGAATPSGMDCSGLTSYVYGQLGITLPHSSAAQRNSGTVVSRANALPGDLMVTPGHVALYAGGDMLIDATPGKGVQFHAIYQTNPVFIRVACARAGQPGRIAVAEGPGTSTTSPPRRSPARSLPTNPRSRGPRPSCARHGPKGCRHVTTVRCRSGGPFGGPAHVLTRWVHGDRWRSGTCGRTDR